MKLHRRAQDAVIRQRLAESQVVRVAGPRAVGKTTSSAVIVEQAGGSIVRLDDPVERSAVAADPTNFLATLPRPVLIDEYQRVPAVLDVIKSQLSRSGPAPGQWLVTGSISITAVAQAVDSLGGRLSDVTMGTLSVDERNDWPEARFLHAVVTDGVTSLLGQRPSTPLNRTELLTEAIRGGFPLITDRSDAGSRQRGFADWINAAVVADAAEVGGIRNIENLRRMMRLYAASTAAITPKDRPLADRLEIDRRTVASYRDLLAGMYVVWDLPAYAPGNAVGQVTKSPKLHLVDSGLAAALAGRDQVAALDRDSQFAGALVETMIANDLRVQLGSINPPVRLYHYRENSAEVDLVVEQPDGTILGLEIKLATNPGDNDLRGLRRLRRSAGNAWGGGVVLCRVPVARTTDDDLVLAPIELAWLGAS